MFRKRELAITSISEFLQTASHWQTAPSGLTGSFAKLPAETLPVKKILMGY